MKEVRNELTIITVVLCVGLAPLVMDKPGPNGWLLVLMGVLGGLKLLLSVLAGDYREKQP